MSSWQNLPNKPSNNSLTDWNDWNPGRTHLIPVPDQQSQEGNKGELLNRIQELQIWVQALSGETPANKNPQNWENPVSGIQAEQRNQRFSYDKLARSYDSLKETIRGLQKDLNRQQESIQSLPVSHLETRYKELKIRVDEIHRTWNQLNTDKITSNGSDPNEGPNPTRVNPMGSDSMNSTPIELNAIRSGPMNSNPVCNALDQVQVNIKPIQPQLVELVQIGIHLNHHLGAYRNRSNML